MPETTFATITDESAVSILAAQLAGKRRERLESQASKPPFRPRRHYASMLNGCARQLVYAHTAWQEKEPFTAEGVAHMEDGREEEKRVIQEIVNDGFEVIEQQVQLDDDKYFITGKLDGKIKWQGHKIPFEIKRMQPYSFDKIESVKDFYNDPFRLKSLRQLTIYLFLHSQPSGLLILSNGLGDRKYIAVPLDYELAESILKDLDTANRHMKAGTLPDRIPYHSKVCGYCPFKRTCLPDMDFGAGAVMGTEELKTAVELYVALKPQASAFEKVKKEIAAAVKEQPLVVVGDHLITGEWKERNIKAQDAKSAQVQRYWGWEVESKGKTNGSM